jgi:hypothetical protein
MKTIAILVTVLAGAIGLKLTFFTAPTAEADSLPIKGASVDISQTHQSIKNLPVQEFHDMTFVFPVLPGGD